MSPCRRCGALPGGPCGLEEDHHLGPEARAQLEVLRLKLEERRLVLVGEAAETNRRRLDRVCRALECSARLKPAATPG